ncbi:hypothetical protein ACWGJ2_37805 [Streptomyces sp. NPDC054796]
MGEGQGPGRLGLDGQGTLSQGDRLRNAARDLDAMGKSLGKGVGPDLGFPSFVDSLFGDDTYGEYGGQRAFPPFARAWNEEIDALAGALREIHAKIGDGVATTNGTDKGAGGRMRGIDTPGGGERGRGEGR